MADHADIADFPISNHHLNLYFAIKSGTSAVVDAVSPCLIGIIHRFNGWRTQTTAACRRSRCACILLSGQGILYSTDDTVGAVGCPGHHVHIQCLSGNNFVNDTLGSVKESLIILGAENIDCNNTLVFNFYRNRNCTSKTGAAALVKTICQIEVSLLGLLSFFCFLLFLFCICFGTLNVFRLLYLINRRCIAFQRRTDASHDNNCRKNRHITAKSFPKLHPASSSSTFLQFQILCLM